MHHFNDNIEGLLLSNKIKELGHMVPYKRKRYKAYIGKDITKLRQNITASQWRKFYFWHLNKYHVYTSFIYNFFNNGI